jgi:Peptidase family M48
MNINKLQQTANEILLSLGVSNILVRVVSVGYNTIAAAGGLTINLKPAVEDVTSIGVIHVQPDYLGVFLNQEWVFIMAHECSHIFHNHIVDTAFWNLLEGILKGPRGQYAGMVELLKMLFAIFSSERLPPDAVTLRNNEYTADATALKVTNNIRAAKSCLLRVCKGNLASSSHVFDLAGRRFPAMTLDARIKEMERRYQAYLRLRRKFI